MKKLFVLLLVLSFNLSIAGTGDVFKDGIWYMAPICDGGGCIYGDENSTGYGNGYDKDHGIAEHRSENQDRIKFAVSNFEKRLLANDGNLFSGGYSSEAFEKMTNFTRALNENLRAEILNDTQNLKEQTEAELHTNTDAANDYISKYNFYINALIASLPFLNASPTFKSSSPKVKDTALYSNFVAKTINPENKFLKDAADHTLSNADALAASGNSAASDRELDRANRLLDNALAPDTVPDVDWKSSGDGKNKLIDLHKKISKIRPTTPDQAIAKQMGLAALLASDEAAANGDNDTAKLASDIAAVGLDIAIGLTPGLNFGQALYEAYTGQSVVTGEELGRFGQAMAILGVATLGGSKLIQPFVKLIGKVGEAALKLASEASRNSFREAVGFTEKTIYSAEKMRIQTPYGDAVQAMTKEALVARAEVAAGKRIYKIGMRGQSNTSQASQFWSLEHPLKTPNYGMRYGIPEENMKKIDFIESATLKPEASFITRPAPGVGNNVGGNIEVVVPENSEALIIESHVSLGQ